MIRIWLWQFPLPPQLQFLASPWASALATLLFWLLVAFALQFLVLRLIKAIARRTDSEIEDVVIDVSRRPIVLLVVILGLISSIDDLMIVEARLATVQRWLTAAAEELLGYWDGRCPARFRVPLDLQGTAFQRAVWQALLDVPPGHTSTYGAIARQVGAPQASRAAGAAIGRNPVAIIVPCHRIVGSNGSLTGFAGGLKRKEALLQHEGALLV